MKDKEISAPMLERICPYCGCLYKSHPAISRRDNTTEICPECGTREALESLGCGPDEQEHILGVIRSHTPQRRNR